MSTSAPNYETDRFSGFPAKVTPFGSGSLRQRGAGTFSRPLFRRLSILFTAIVLWLGLAVPAGYAAEGCQFALGFKSLHDQIPGIVGDCLSNEQDGGGGARIQRTANGILVWRQTDNLSAFTDGAHLGEWPVWSPAARKRPEIRLGSQPGARRRGIFIEVGKQSLTAYEDGRIVLQTPVTTGGPQTPTPPGSFSVIAKRSNFIFKSPWPQPDPRWYPDSWVNYALLYERTGFFVHDAPGAACTDQAPT